MQIKSNRISYSLRGDCSRGSEPFDNVVERIEPSAMSEDCLPDEDMDAESESSMPSEADVEETESPDTGLRDFRENRRPTDAPIVRKRPMVPRTVLDCE